MRVTLLTALFLAAILPAWAEPAPQMSMNVPGATDAVGRLVLTFINKDLRGMIKSGGK